MGAYLPPNKFWQDFEYDESSDDALSCDDITYWGEEHFDVLQELFEQFKASGERVFGRAFYQFGDFTEFVHFVKRNTVTDPTDLLKQQVKHVGSVGPCSGSQHGLSRVQTTGDGGPSRDGRQGMGRSWSGAVSTESTRGGKCTRD